MATDLATLAVCGWAAAAAAWDLAQHRIPNVLTGGAALVAIACFFFTGHGPLGAALRETLGVTAVLAVPGVLAFHTGRLGGGDVKLFLAMSLVGGPLVFATAMLLGSLGCLLLLLAGHSEIWLLWLRSAAPRLLGPLLGRRAVPLGVPYGVGLIVALAGLG
jgi:Flp pilus assembly protein protease CpaA